MCMVIFIIEYVEMPSLCLYAFLILIFFLAFSFVLFKYIPPSTADQSSLFLFLIYQLHFPFE